MPRPSTTRTARAGGSQTSERSDARRAGIRASERLRRLLVVVPYIVANPGISLAELSRLFGASEAELVDDLHLLFLSGLPPYGPGDLIDVEFEEGRVWVHMADYFGRPVTLTRSEALALYLKGKALLGAPGLDEAPALASALAKIEGGLGRDTLGSLVGRVEVATSGRAARSLAAVRRAVERHQRLAIEYYGAAKDEITVRRIDPEHLFTSMGNWYVVAWDHLSENERTFRADRIRSVKETGESFRPRGLEGPGRALYTPTGEDTMVVLLLGPGSRWVTEYYRTESVKPREDGWVEAALPAKDLPWVAKLVLRLGGEARVLEPPELVEMVRRTAGETLALYRRGARS